MATTQFKNTVFDCEMEAAGNGVPTNSQDARDLLDSLAALNAAIPLKKFDVERDAVDLTLYSYKFEAVDGRRWQQSFSIPVDGSEPSMDFDTKGDKWKMSEFSPHRMVREKTIALIKVYGTWKVKCRW